MKNQLKSIAIGAALFTSAQMGCGGDDNTGPLGNVDSLIILQRPKRNDMGDIFQYTSYIAGARIVELSPPTADGTLTTICCDQAGPEYANIDINSYDLSFDAKEIVFAGKLSDSGTYGLYRVNIADGTVTALATDPQRDYVSPIYLPGDQIMFTSNAVVEPGANQFEDEYERGTTTQLGTIGIDGTNENLGPRNLSHRTGISLASDGRVIMTQWDHLGPMNAGHLMFVDSDMTDLREAFGKEGTAASNSTLKAREISPGRFVAIGTARNRTINAGALLDVRLGFPSTDSDGNVSAADRMSEANASYVNWTPDVPLDNSPSADTIGRYYDAFPLNAKENADLLVSWADGPVESGTLAAAGLSANFGIYLYNTETQTRSPILDDPNMWDIFARPLAPRNAPALASSTSDNTLNGQTLIGSMNVYDSTLHTFNPGEIFGVRAMEGFSSEEGFPEMFGTTMFEGHANLGVNPVQPDGSWLASVPANIPVHLQTVDKFGMSLFNEPVWFSGRANESRVCGGCHEDRAATTVINPGITQAGAVGPTADMGTIARADRMMAAADFANPDIIDPAGDAATTLASTAKLVGMGWDDVVQPVFDAKCVSCHNATTGTDIGAYQIINPATGAVVLNWHFDLSNTPMTVNYGADDTEANMETFSNSYFTMAGPDMEAIEKNNLMIVGDFKIYMLPTDAAHSPVIQKVNPTQLFPNPDSTVRAFDVAANPPHSMNGANYAELTPTEFYKLILAADMGVNFYARENNPKNAQ